MKPQLKYLTGVIMEAPRPEQDLAPRWLLVETSTKMGTKVGFTRLLGKFLMLNLREMEPAEDWRSDIGPKVAQYVGLMNF